MARVSQLPIKRSFRAHPSALFQVRQFVREQAADCSLPESMGDDLVLAVSEACVNAVVHTRSSQIQLLWRAQDGHVQVQVEDQGVFDRKVPLPEFDGTAGRGIPLILALVDEVTIREGTPARPGTVIRLTKYTDDASAKAGVG
jgi:anti-sigma regulatory factor (Ser/Thr protein kinase)